MGAVEILTEDDLIALTGKRQHAAQVRFLRRAGLSPIVRDDGVPVVTWTAVNNIIAGKAEPHRPSLNLRAIQKAA